MVDRESVDRIVNPWRYEDGAEQAPTTSRPGGPIATKLESTIDPGGGGSVRIDATVLHTSASRLEQLRTEVRGGVQSTLRSTDHAAVGRNLEVTKAVQYVHDRWEEKLTHLLEDMQERVTRVHKAADNWSGTEVNVNQSMS